MSPKKILVFQHIEQEGLENIEKFFSDEKFKFITIKLFKGNKIPDNLDKFSMMIVLGGPMDSWMENDHPWLIKEKKSIKKFVVDLEKPFLGICLGCQLLGEILGARILKSKISEIGLYKINSNNNIKNDRIFKDFPDNFEVFQWHSYEVDNIKNEDFQILASSKNTDVQLFKYKNHAYGMQFHLEVEDKTIHKWCEIESYKKNLEEHLNHSEIIKISKNSKRHFHKIALLCKNFVNNFSELILDNEFNY